MVRVTVRTPTNTRLQGDEVESGINEAARSAATKGFRVSQILVPKDTTELMMSGKPPRERDGRIVWGYDAEHTLYVEKGTAPHWAPIDALKGWARRVLGSERAAWAVQWKIAREGTDPQPFIGPAVRAQNAALKDTGVVASIKERF